MNQSNRFDDDFSKRHIGPSIKKLGDMLETVGVSSLDELIMDTVPRNIALKTSLKLPEAMSEYKYLRHIRAISRKNRVFRSYIGMGYYDCIVPSVIQRNILENPGWYTHYTPYQAEISQGRLEALLNFQTMVCDLTGMEIANASLLDEGTAAGEAMTMLHRVRSRELVKRDASRFFVSEKSFPQTIEVLRSRAEPLGIELVTGDYKKIDVDESFFGALLQYPDSEGNIEDYSGFIEKVHKTGAQVAVAADLMSLALIRPPGEFGADVVVGSTQRFGVPLGYGGPHAAYYATREKYQRQVPGRIIGVSVDQHGSKAYRMALQTREQHIRREKATSNICTAQALLAVMAGMYAVYHGPDGIRRIAQKIHTHTCLLEKELKSAGYDQKNRDFFDTLLIDISSRKKGFAKKLRSEAESRSVNFRYLDETAVGISLDETVDTADVKRIIEIFHSADGNKKAAASIKASLAGNPERIEKEFRRKSDYLTHEVFNIHNSETEMLRYMKELENRDLSLAHSMIPLGSCTMKLNATTQMIPISWEEFSGIHPFVPLEQAEGYQQVIDELGQYLCEITGLPGVSLQPNSGAQGEYAGLMVIRAYHRDRGDYNRDIVLIPSSAHGTNPASASISGMRVVVVKCDSEGNIDLEDLKKKCSKHSEELSSIMVTYPSTHGVFEPDIKELCDIVHSHGGQVYMDGANLNAQVGLTTPGIIGADVCHINLHKTFSIPHGGGGPGMGPICVASHLSKYLPGHPVINPGNSEKSIPSVAAAPWGSASILLISYAYIRLLGVKGVTESSKYAILNANYTMKRLEKYYPVLYQSKKKRVAHEFILDLRGVKRSSGIDAEDVAKRLMDYGFHAPTMSWPVPGTIMIEPTESESKAELDRFCDALISIYQEIKEVEEGKYDIEDNVLVNSPHIIDDAVSDNWKHSYPREKAYFPIESVRHSKFWVPVSRIDNPYGDKNLVCTCPPVEEYMEKV